jgi:hypothetical protein
MLVIEEYFRGENFPWISKFLSEVHKKISGISSQMTNKVKKRHKSFKWTKEANKSFNILKEKIM